MRSNKALVACASNDVSKPYAPPYPAKPNRYNALWWNGNYQYCYSAEEISLLQRIHTLHNQLGEGPKRDVFFELREEKQWHDWWTCIRPAYTLQNRDETRSYTLPNRPAKDSTHYPLWHYSDNMTTQIANWQGMRDKQQTNSDLINDPAMLVFEELKDWFLNVLSEKECKKEELDHIAKRQSYIKNLVHILPDFGPDRLHLHEIQQSLDHAAKLIVSCVANQELPQLLSGLIISEKNLETIIGTYLHFLLIDEHVADNFASDYRENHLHECGAFPVCKVYQAADTRSESSDTHLALEPYHKFNRFYHLETIAEKNGAVQLQPHLRDHLLKHIKFADFVTAQDKDNYLKTIAALESLTQARSILEKFQHILPKIGTYAFAINNLDHVETLSTNSIHLINKINFLTKKLINSADHGLAIALSDAKHHLIKNHFQKNLLALETRVAQHTTITAQLETYCQDAIDSMHKYQQEMKKLVRNVQSGEASRELELAMHDLFLQINHLNAVLPSLLSDQPFVINPDQPSFNTLSHSELPTPDSSDDKSEEYCSPTLIQTSNAEPRAKTFFHSIWNFGDKITSAIISSTMIPSAPLKLENPATALLIADSAQKNAAETPSVTIQSSFNQPLALTQKAKVVEYVLHYVRKYSFFTLPQNVIRDLSPQELDTVHQQHDLLSKLHSDFTQQKKSLANRCGLFADQFKFIQTGFKELNHLLRQATQNKKSSRTILSEIQNKLMRIQDTMHLIALENKQIKKIRIQDNRTVRRNQKTGKKTVVVIEHDVVNHRVVRKVSEKNFSAVIASESEATQVLLPLNK